MWCSCDNCEREGVVTRAQQVKGWSQATEPAPSDNVPLSHAQARVPSCNTMPLQSPLHMLLHSSMLATAVARRRSRAFGRVAELTYSLGHEKAVTPGTTATTKAAASSTTLIGLVLINMRGRQTACPVMLRRLRPSWGTGGPARAPKIGWITNSRNDDDARASTCSACSLALLGLGVTLGELETAHAKWWVVAATRLYHYRGGRGGGGADCLLLARADDGAFSHRLSLCKKSKCHKKPSGPDHVCPSAPAPAPCPTRFQIFLGRQKRWMTGRAGAAATSRLG